MLIFTTVRNYLPILLILSLAMAIGCKKESFTNSTEAKLIIGNDSLRFDTVFTTAGSVTQYFLIKNENKQKINISNVQLMGGNASAFKMNVDGSQGTQFTN